MTDLYVKEGYYDAVELPQEDSGPDGRVYSHLSMPGNEEAIARCGYVKATKKPDLAVGKAAIWTDGKWKIVNEPKAPVDNGPPLPAPVEGLA